MPLSDLDSVDDTRLWLVKMGLDNCEGVTTLNHCNWTSNSLVTDAATPFCRSWVLSFNDECVTITGNQFALGTRVNCLKNYQRFFFVYRTYRVICDGTKNSVEELVTTGTVNWFLTRTNRGRTLLTVDWNNCRIMSSSGMFWVFLCNILIKLGQATHTCQKYVINVQYIDRVEDNAYLL